MNSLSKRTSNVQMTRNIWTFIHLYITSKWNLYLMPKGLDALNFWNIKYNKTRRISTHSGILQEQLQVIISIITGWIKESGPSPFEHILRQKKSSTHYSQMTILQLQIVNKALLLDILKGEEENIDKLASS